MIVSLVVSALVFGCATYLAIEVANWLFAKDGSAVKGSPETMSLLRALLPIANGIVGAMLASYSIEWQTFIVVGIVCSALAMATWSELGYGRVPDLVLIVPLVVLVGTAILAKQWGQIYTAILLALPFIVLAFTTRGKGVARTDIELAAVGGAMLGFKFGIFAFVAALGIAFMINFRNRAEKRPIELTPYLAGSIVVALLVRLILPAEMS